MTLFIQNDAAGVGAGTVQPELAMANLTVIANLDTGIGLAPATGNLQQVTYARTDPGIPPTRLAALVNTNFAVNPAGIDIIVLAVGPNFTLRDGTLITTVGGTALAPAGTTGPGAPLNGTVSCVVIYDTSDKDGEGYCLARAGSRGTLDLRLSLPVMAYHELSHAFRIVTGTVRQLTPACNPSSPEERAAITDENDMRIQLAAINGEPVVLRDPGIHCGRSCGGGGNGNCCIVASVSSGSPLSVEVAELRTLRDQFLRRSEVGHAFFDSLHYAYYGFSPQVIGIMATDLDVRATALNGFVRPLIRILRLVRDHAIDGLDPDELGRRCVAAFDDPAETSAARSALVRALAIILDHGSAGLSPAEQTVASLLAGRALPDPHVSWGLIEPVRLYHLLLRLVRTGAPSAAVGRWFTEAVDDWAGNLPIDTCWGAFDLATARRELDILESTLLRNPGPRRVFLRRLAERHPTATAIARAVAERSEPGGRREPAERGRAAERSEGVPT
ncbi:hypothetical protein ACFP2T_42450 [Plantactinospora solaniradicis]|uniref:Uncharacterized protein n=1 Tax=Plantactinospora solaniradicis TaxID=1723736 RepID=A0ABW1KPN7_9ACTN